MKPKPTPRKVARKGPTLDQLEALECADWVGDCKRRERQQTEGYKARVALAEKFKKRGS